MCFEIPKIRFIGMVTICFLTVYQIAILIFNGVSSSYLTPKGSSFSLNIFGNLEFFLLFMNTIISVIGFFGFYLTNKGLMIYYTIVNVICFIITLWITIVMLAVGSQGTNSAQLSNAVSCFDSYTFIAKKNQPINYRYAIDYYMEQSDQLFCSSDCPCALLNKSKFSNNSLLWKVQSSGPINFPDCNSKALLKAESKARLNGYYGTVSDVFYTMNWLEQKFNCVGFCIQNYTDNNGLQANMEKFVFSDINRGLPQNDSCLLSLMKWIIKFCITIGVLNIFILLINVFLIVLGYAFWCNYKDINPPTSTTYNVVNPNYQGVAVIGQPVINQNMKNYEINFGQNDNASNDPNNDRNYNNQPTPSRDNHQINNNFNDKNLNNIDNNYQIQNLEVHNPVPLTTDPNSKNQKKYDNY